MIVVNVTHEAVEKIGGIGAVIEGLTTCQGFGETFDRSILVGPVFASDRPAAERLAGQGEVLYSSQDGIDAGGAPRVA